MDDHAQIPDSSLSSLRIAVSLTAAAEILFLALAAHAVHGVFRLIFLILAALAGAALIFSLTASVIAETVQNHRRAWVLSAFWTYVGALSLLLASVLTWFGLQG